MKAAATDSENTTLVNTRDLQENKMQITKIKNKNIPNVTNPTDI